MDSGEIEGCCCDITPDKADVIVNKFNITATGEEEASELLFHSYRRMWRKGRRSVENVEEFGGKGEKGRGWRKKLCGGAKELGGFGGKGLGGRGEKGLGDVEGVENRVVW